MATIDELDSELKVEDLRLTENNTSSKERWDIFRKKYDWARFPLEILFYVILTIGAWLMGLSLYQMTKSLLIAIGSPAFSEIGLIAWYKAKDRPKNSIVQTETARKGRNWHVGTSVILLVLNLVIDTTTEMLGIKIDGIIYLVFGVIGLTSLNDILWYFKYKDADDETTIRNDQAKRMEDIKKNTMKLRMDALADAEKIKAEEKVKMWKLLAPEKARQEARIEAAKELMESYGKNKMSPDEVNKLWKNVGYAEAEEIEDSQDSGKRQYNKSGKYKKPQLQAPKTSGENPSLLDERAKKLENQFVEED
jgi:hypothetical protein